MKHPRWIMAAMVAVCLVAFALVLRSEDRERSDDYVRLPNTAEILHNRAIAENLLVRAKCLYLPRRRSEPMENGGTRVCDASIRHGTERCEYTFAGVEAKYMEAKALYDLWLDVVRRDLLIEEEVRDDAESAEEAYLAADKAYRDYVRYAETYLRSSWRLFGPLGEGEEELKRTGGSSQPDERFNLFMSFCDEAFRLGLYEYEIESKRNARDVVERLNKALEKPKDRACSKTSDDSTGGAISDNEVFVKTEEFDSNAHVDILCDALTTEDDSNRKRKVRRLLKRSERRCDRLLRQEAFYEWRNNRCDPRVWQSLRMGRPIEDEQDMARFAAVAANIDNRAQRRKVLVLKYLETLAWKAPFFIGDEMEESNALLNSRTVIREFE